MFDPKPLRCLFLLGFLVRGSLAACVVENPDWIGDGICDDRSIGYNTPECGYDGGDCADLNAVLSQYPNCYVPYPEDIGDGSCDDFPPYNTPECGYDGGDCVMEYPDCPIWVDCDLFYDFVSRYPDCAVEYPEVIGNGYCDAEYNTAECGYENGDCDRFNAFYPDFISQFPDCIVERPEFLGDGICDSASNGYNTPECNYDAGDCG